MIFKEKTSFELAENRKGLLCPQAIRLGIFCLLLKKDYRK